MKPFIVSSLAALLVAVSTPATADTAAAAAGDAQASCAIARVMVSAARRAAERIPRGSSPHNYVKDNDLQCKVGDDGRTSNCTGGPTSGTNRSVYDDSDPATLTVGARVEPTTARNTR